MLLEVALLLLVIVGIIYLAYSVIDAPVVEDPEDRKLRK